MAPWTSVYIKMVEICEAQESKLNEWENGFISSLRTLLERDREITFKQTEVLEKIYLKIL